MSAYMTILNISNATKVCTSKTNTCNTNSTEYDKLILDFLIHLMVHMYVTNELVLKLLSLFQIYQHIHVSINIKMKGESPLIEKLKSSMALI